VVFKAFLVLQESPGLVEYLDKLEVQELLVFVESREYRGLLEPMELTEPVEFLALLEQLEHVE
jgi:hypothetical protein